jgi:hypothetical protein
MWRLSYFVDCVRFQRLEEHACNACQNNKWFHSIEERISERFHNAASASYEIALGEKEDNIATDNVLLTATITTLWR